MLGMVEARERLRLALEPRQAFRVPRHRRRQHFDRDLTTKPRVARSIDFAHPSNPKGGQQLVLPESSPWCQHASVSRANCATNARQGTAECAYPNRRV